MLNLNNMLASHKKLAVEKEVAFNAEKQSLSKRLGRVRYV